MQGELRDGIFDFDDTVFDDIVMVTLMMMMMVMMMMMMMTIAGWSQSSRSSQ